VRGLSGAERPLGDIFKRAANVVLEAAHNIKAAITDKVYDAVSSISCKATDGLNTPAVTACLEESAIAAKTARVQDPNFWAQVTRAADLARLVYTPFAQLNASQANNPRTQRYQIYTLISSDHSADAGIVIRNNKIAGTVERIDKPGDSCNKDPNKQGCFKKLAEDRDVLWTKWMEQEFTKWPTAQGTAKLDSTAIKTAAVNTPPTDVEVVVRGSQQVVDWIQNFKAWKTNTDRPNEKIHSGFSQQFEALLPSILAGLSPFKTAILKGQTKLWFFGHSLGGAVCQLLADEVVRQWGIPRKTVKVITFGSPRVGNAAWAARAATFVDHTRFKYTVDLVPEVPPSNFGYVHSATVSYGLIQLPRTSFARSIIRASPFQVVCPGECSRSRADGPLIAMCHSSDLAYATATSAIFHFMKDMYPLAVTGYFPNSQTRGRSNYDQLADLEKFYQTLDNSALSLQVLQCFGDSLCEVLRQYPGANVDNLRTCLYQWKSETGYRLVSFGLMYINARPKQEPWITLYNVRNHLNAADDAADAQRREDKLKTCMAPFVVPGFYSRLADSDWTASLGDMVEVFRRLNAITGKNYNLVTVKPPTTTPPTAPRRPPQPLANLGAGLLPHRPPGMPNPLDAPGSLAARTAAYLNAPVHQ